MVLPFDTTPECVAPPYVAEHTVPVAVLAVPEFCMTRTIVELPAEDVPTDAVTCAELVNDPNRPNTNPAMAMAAMRVMAMRMTVGRCIYELVTVPQGNSH